MHKTIRHGYCPHSDDPNVQITEVIARFQLAKLVSPHSRCLACNGLLQGVAKAEVLPQLAPSTRVHSRRSDSVAAAAVCMGPAPHFERFQIRVTRILASV